MSYDKKSFLAGVALGRQLKGWSSGGEGSAYHDYFVVIWYDYDHETVLDSQACLAGDTVTFKGTVPKPSDPDYAFSGWDKSTQNVLHNMRVYPISKRLAFTADYYLDTQGIFAYNTACSRLPAYKTNTGRAFPVFYHHSNGPGSPGGYASGKWHGVLLIALTQENAAFTAGAVTRQNPFEYLGMKWYVCLMAADPTWGGGEITYTDYNFPLHNRGGEWTITVNGYTVNTAWITSVMDAAHVSLLD